MTWINSDREAFDFPTRQEAIAETLESDSLEYYRSLITKTKCWCGYEGLQDLPIEMYPHSGGWTVGGHLAKQWLYVTCPKCRYQWALWKLAVPREASE